MDNQLSKEAIALLLETGKELAEPQIIQSAGHNFLVVNGQKHEFDQKYPCGPATHETFTLDGLVEFIRTDVDGLISGSKKPWIVSVKDPSAVRLCSPIREDSGNRDILAFCNYRGDCNVFNTYHDTEYFMVLLQTRFQETESLNMVKQVVGNMTDTQSLDCADDGVTQKLTIKKGVVTNGNVMFKNPVPLVPIRFFTEVEQVESPFVLRVKGGSDGEPVRVALFECDGGNWEIKAVQAIGNWLREKLDGCNIQVIA